MGSTAVNPLYSIEDNDQPKQSKYTIEDAPSPAGPSTLERGVGAFNKGVGMDMSAPPQKPSIGEMIAGPIAPAVKGVLQSSSSAAQTGANRFHQPGIVNKIGGGLEYGLSGIPIVGPGIVTAMEHGARQEWPEMLGSTAAAATQMAAPEMEKNGAGIGNAIDAMNPVNWRSGIRSKMYDANGELTPGAHAIVHPTNLAEYGAKKLFPEPEESVRARNANANYEQTGQDLMRRGLQQARIDRSNLGLAKAQENALGEDIERRNSPFEQRAQDLTRRGVEQDKLNALAARANNGTVTLGGPSTTATNSATLGNPSLAELGNATPFQPPVAGQSTSTSSLGTVPRLGPQEEPLIVSPGSTAPKLKTTYQSYSGSQLQELMDKGDVAAMRDFIRNPRPGAHLPDNAKFLLEQAERMPWRNRKR